MRQNQGPPGTQGKLRGWVSICPKDEDAAVREAGVGTPGSDP